MEEESGLPETRENNQQKDFFIALEQVIHQAQAGVIRKCGLDTEPADPVVILASEIGAVSWVITISRQEIEEIGKKRQGKISALQVIAREEELSQEIDHQLFRLMSYKTRLHHTLRKMKKSKRQKYEKLFKDLFFEGSQEVLEWVQNGLKDPPSEIPPAVSPVTNLPDCFNKRDETA